MVGLFSIIGASRWNSTPPSCARPVQADTHVARPCPAIFRSCCRWLMHRGTGMRRIMFPGEDERDCQAVEPVRHSDAAALWQQNAGRVAKQLAAQLYRPPAIAFRDAR